MTDVAALYIDPRGPYPTIEGVDCWDESRDARKYDGPWPIVAHPPCGPWGSMKHRASRVGSECAPLALAQVRKFGGVLEHPRGSSLWKDFDIARPGCDCGHSADDHGFVGYDIRSECERCSCVRFEPWRDELGGFSLQVDQCEWGHPARKRTWLYLVGVDFYRSDLIDPPFSGRQPTKWISGTRKRNPARGTTPAHMGFCSMPQRRRTPIEFARYLVRLARSAKPWERTG